jgi:hypothetical protein
MPFFPNSSLFEKKCLFSDNLLIETMFSGRYHGADKVIGEANDNAILEKIRWFCISNASEITTHYQYHHITEALNTRAYIPWKIRRLHSCRSNCHALPPPG